MIQRLSVALTQNLPQALSYQAEHPIPILPGQRVVVPLGRRESVAWVIAGESQYTGRLRSVIALFADPFCFEPAFLNAVSAISRTYLQSQGQLLEAALPLELKASKGYRVVKGSPLTESGLALCQSLGASKFAQVSGQNPETPVCSYEGPLQINGPDRFGELITLAEEIRARGGSLLTVAGDAQTIDALTVTLPGVCAYHSKISQKERRRVWQAAQLGEPQWIIGGVSAALLPIRGLTAILIADANNPAHFSRFFRDYGAAHLARLRAQAEGLPLICSSPRPTVLSSWFGPSPETKVEKLTETSQPVTVKPARWDRPEAVVRLGNAILDDYSHDKRSLYVVAAASASQSSWCPKCRKRQSGDSLQACPKCAGNLTFFPKPSVPWLGDILGRRSEMHLKMLTKESQVYQTDKLVISAAQKLAFAGDGYDRIVIIGPESWISLDELDGALRMWGLVEELRERLSAAGEISIFSAYHFHYALKLINETDAFFEREMNYRRWFGLPPLCAVYQIDFRHKELRALAERMRCWIDYFKTIEGVRIDQLRLLSRKPFRGFYKGSLVFHGQAEQIWQSGLFPERNTNAKLIMA